MVGELFVDSRVLVPKFQRWWLRLDAVNMDELGHRDWSMSAMFSSIGDYVNAKTIRTGVTV